MKILHLSDLHIGKTIHGINLIDSGDQSDWLDKLLTVLNRERPQAIVIAGDIYDRSAPSREALQLVSRMLTEFAALAWKPCVMMVAGNHDAGPMIDYLRSIVQRQNIHMAGMLEREMAHVTLEDECGSVTFWLMPYAYPASINQVLGTAYRGYDEAFRAYLAAQDIDFGTRNVIVAHQNITAFGSEAQRGGSETFVGGVGGIDFTVFDGFEYAALGHIHAAQSVGRDAVRYAGSPLCYHFSELKYPDKGPVLVELGDKGTAPTVTVCPIAPLHPMREVRGTLTELLDAERMNTAEGEYVRAVVLQEADGIGGYREAAEQLRAVLAEKGSLLLDIAVERVGERRETPEAVRDPGQKSVEELFREFWISRRDSGPDDAECALLDFIAEQERVSDPERDGPTEAELDAILAFAAQQEEESK